MWFCILCKSLHQSILQVSLKILGAALDVLEYEKKNFENTFDNKIHKNFLDLIQNEKVILTPHIAGWTYESHIKLAKIFHLEYLGI